MGIVFWEKESTTKYQTWSYKELPILQFQVSLSSTKNIEKRIFDDELHQPLQLMLIFPSFIRASWFVKKRYLEITTFLAGPKGPALYYGYVTHTQTHSLTHSLSPTEKCKSCC